LPISSLEQQRVSVLLQDYCDRRVPPEVRDQLEIRFRFEGNAAYLFERRPAWRRSGEWLELLVAKFRYFVGRREWQLYWRDSNERWHVYDLLPPSRRFERLLAEVDADPTCIFWG
jgi:hypothetical protein